MTGLILDTSVTMAWCFEDESSTYADGVLDHLVDNVAFAPGIWPLEVTNVLVVAERRKRITLAESARFVDLLRQLPITVDLSSDQRMFSMVMSLAREMSLSTYDAAYLDLAMQTDFPLATLDERLRQAAANSGVQIWGE